MYGNNMEGFAKCILQSKYVFMYLIAISFKSLNTTTWRYIYDSL